MSTAPTASSASHGRRKYSSFIRRAAIPFGVLGAFLAVGAMGIALNAHQPPAASGSGGCPGSNAIGNFLSDTNVSSTYTLDGNGSVATYWFSSSNESSTSGVPGLISYCVYPANATLPGSATAVALGADGTPFTVSVGTHQGYFAFQRGNGNPTNVPLDGAQNVEMGNATWSAGAPTIQTIVLHINDAWECNQLYGGNPGTCFVYGAASSSHCSTGGVAPSSLHISIPSPKVTLTAGENLTTEYEYAIVNYTAADNGAIIYVPTVDFRLPLSGPGVLTQVAAPHQFTVSSGGWSSPISRTLAVGSTIALGTKSAWATTANLAVMTSGGPAGMIVEFRWAWILNNSGTITQQFSVPSGTASAPDFPSMFAPAPWVHATASTNTTAATGTFFGATLQGAIDNTSFRTVVEDVNGLEAHCQVQSNPSTSATTFSVGVPLTYVANNTPLLPGNYIVHIHDQAGAIVIQFLITVTP